MRSKFRTVALLGLVVVALAALAAPAFAAPISVLAAPMLHAQVFGNVPDGVLAVAAKILAIGVTIWKCIDGVKDNFPEWTAAHPAALRIFNAVAALLASLGTCWAMGQVHSWLEVAWCTVQGVLAFLTAAGLHDAQSKKIKALEGR